MLPYYLLVFLTSFLIGIALTSTKNIHGKYTLDFDEGIQKFHTKSTPRIGGISIYLGIVSTAFLSELKINTSLIYITSGLILLTGLIEDITKNLKPVYRFTIILIVALLSSQLTDSWIQKIDIKYIDQLISQYTALKVLLTIIAITGLINAINIIDGFHGLAGGVSLISLTGLYLISIFVGDTEIQNFCLITIAATLGFFIINFPLGKIFLGDGGAYLVGFLLSILSISLTTRNPQVSPWAPVLICAYPIIETLFSIYRKNKREGHHPGKPDKVHLHMLVYRRVIANKHKFKNSDLKNSCTSVVLWAFHIISILPALVWWDNTFALQISFVFYGFFYLSIYNKLTKFKWF